MMQMAMTLPDPVAEQLCTRWDQDVPRNILELVACEGYCSGALGTYQVQQVLGCEARDEVCRFLKEHGLYTGAPGARPCDPSAA